MKISEKSFEELDKPIILEELYNNLKNMKCERVPGIDGIPVELIGMIGEDLLYRFIFNNKKRTMARCFEFEWKCQTRMESVILATINKNKINKK